MNGDVGDRLEDQKRGKGRSSSSPLEAPASSLLKPSKLRDGRDQSRPIRSGTQARLNPHSPDPSPTGRPTLAGQGKATASALDRSRPLPFQNPGQLGSLPAPAMGNESATVPNEHGNEVDAPCNLVVNEASLPNVNQASLPSVAAGSSLSSSELGNSSRSVSEPRLSAAAVAVTSSLPLPPSTSALPIRALPPTVDGFGPNAGLTPLPHYRNEAVQGSVEGQAGYAQNYQPSYPLTGSDPASGAYYPSLATRRAGWPHQVNQSQQHQQHQQHLQQGNDLGPQPSYPHPSLLPQYAPNLAEQRVPFHFGAPPLANPAGGSNNASVNQGGNASLMGVHSAFPSSHSHQAGFQAQQRYPEERQHPSVNLTQYSPFHRVQQYPSAQSGSGMKNLGGEGASSEWNALPQLSLQALRDPSSSTSSGQQTSSFDRGKGHQSRARLQRHLRELQAEMVDLKERVRVAENPYRDASPAPSPGFSDSRYDSAFVRGAEGEYQIRDGRVDSGRSLTAPSAGGLTESTGSSSLGAYPAASAQRQEQPDQTMTMSTDPSSSGSASGRRGTWRTSDSSNVLVFNTADSRHNDSQMLPTTQYEAGADRDGDRGDEEDEGDDSSKRYQCLVPGCLKTFTTSGHARRHSRTHLGHKLFVCPHDGCRSTFTRRDNCRQHQRARHRMTLPVRESSEPELPDDFFVNHQQRDDQRLDQSAPSSSSRPPL